MPDRVAQAFLDLDVYRLILPRDLGGKGVDPLTLFDLVEEVSTYDGSVGWNYALGSNGGSMAGALAPSVAAKLFATKDSAMCGSGPPQGRAVATEGGYRVTGRYAWASGIHQAKWVMGGCFVFDGEERRVGPHGGPVVIHMLAPRSDANVLDTWHTGGMRGTGSTEFELNDVFVPNEHTFMMFGAEPTHPDPLYRVPTSFFGFTLTAVPLGIARATIEALRQLAANRPSMPGRAGLRDQPHVHYTLGKARAMVEASRLGVRDAFTRMWDEVRGDGATLESRARLRSAAVHAVETSIEAVGMCYRAAGGTALFEQFPFERALRDVNATGGHVVFQRAMMEDCGRVCLDLPPLLPMF
ncbi:acyl-CoA dehydrogenase family protein [Novosphingobium taihuense]|uniref:Alkylation response protein AidB-like acyl-CoA dehydrogenase n=1 Tax=Novosphingobium taihuense TaxID=260085 RepID=A0A7W7ADG6_9SPHN|nr:acyl-CoA dehydrogenase family protein [Novosphingobium taihuense]MBB4615024.1 alkylation response protein AidB-like acyl-CoA dehydrogenase [Novosphingobium taihuense]